MTSTRYDNVEAILSTVNVLQYETLAQSIGRPILEIDHVITSVARLLQYIPEESRLENWRKFCAHDNYFVTTESIQFLLAVKPWRLSTLQHPNKSIVLDKIGEKCADVSFDLLQRLTSNKQLAAFVCSLTYDSKPIEFLLLHHILKRLRNIKELRVDLSQYEMGMTTDKICDALNQLTSLRCAWIKKMGCYNICPPILLNKLRYGRIFLGIPETPTITVTKFAYRSLYLTQLYGARYAAQWTYLVQQSASIAHLTIITRKQQFDLQSIIPQNLTSLKLEYTLDNIYPLTMRRQNVLKRLNLRAAQFQWHALAVWCPHICFLKLICVEIYGHISGLRLVTLEHNRVTARFDLRGFRFDYAAARHMCVGTLTHLKMRAASVPSFNAIIYDWTVNPDFLVGSHVRYAYGTMDFQVWNTKYKKRVVLLARKALLCTKR